MIYVALALICIIILVRMAAPSRYAVHASQAIPLPKGIRPEGKWLLGGFVYDDNGKRFDISGKFIGRVAGASMASCGMPAGETFIGDYIQTDSERHSLKNGDIVVVEGAAEFSETGLRLRIIDQTMSDDMVSFLSDGFGRAPRKRPATEIVARVTHAIDNARMENGEWVASLMQSIRDFPKKILKTAA
jgi:hypothetical protein